MTEVFEKLRKKGRKLRNIKFLPVGALYSFHKTERRLRFFDISCKI